MQKRISAILHQSTTSGSDPQHTTSVHQVKDHGVVTSGTFSTHSNKHHDTLPKQICAVHQTSF